MSANDEFGASEAPGEGEVRERLQRLGHDGGDGGTTSWWIRSIPADIRAVAEAAAKKWNMRISDFLSEAILDHVARLETAESAEADRGAGHEADLVKALEDYRARLEALESRLAAAEGRTAQPADMKAQTLVTNLVERPWLKKPEPRNIS